jgi:hypothetical protein
MADRALHLQAKSMRSELRSRIAAQWWLKFFGITGFITIFFVGYFLLLRFPVFPVTTMPLVALDRAIGFHPSALVLYVSLWVYVSLPPTLLRERAVLMAYAKIATGVAATGLMIFFFWPTSTPAATGIEWADYPALAWLKGVDAAENACPSLHVAFAVLSGVWLDRIVREMGGSFFMRMMNACWCVGIVYSTLATRQHVMLDVAGGAALGLVAAAIRPGRRTGG